MAKLNKKFEFVYFCIFRYILEKVHIWAIFSIFMHILHSCYLNVRTIIELYLENIKICYVLVGTYNRRKYYFYLRFGKAKSWNRHIIKLNKLKQNSKNIWEGSESGWWRFGP